MKDRDYRNAGSVFVLNVEDSRNSHDGDIQFSESFLDVHHIDLLELTVADIVFLVGDACASTSDSCRGQRGGEDEAGCIGPDHVDEVGRASNIATNSAVSLSESAWQEL